MWELSFSTHCRDQFSSADLDPFNNQWSQIYNFTNQGGESDWSFAQKTTPPITPQSEGDISGCGLNFQRGRSTVSFSVGPLARPIELEVIITEEKIIRVRYFIDGLQIDRYIARMEHT